MQKFVLSFLAIGLALLPSCKKEVSQKPGRPNIIFVMTDDHAAQAISSYGSTLIQTPNIDRLAREGVRFTHSFVTNSICAPSRAVMLTGKYSHLNGLRDNRDEFDGSQLTFPKLLQQAGYQTAMVGKWHLKTTPTGFDYWNVLVGQGDYYSPVMVEMGDTLEHKGKYVTDLITDFALQVLENRDSTRPFCLLYHQKAPHRNWMPDPQHLGMYQDEDLPLPESFFDSYKGRRAAEEAEMRITEMYHSFDLKLMPGDYEKESDKGGSSGFNAEIAWQGAYNRMSESQKQAWDAHYGPENQAFRQDALTGEELAKWKYQRYLKDYLRCVASVDDNLGRLLQYLDETGLAENTLIVYTSDQGFYLGEHGWYDKRFMYEESLGMPLIVRYPSEIPAGQVSDDMVLNLDFAPTFLDFAGLKVPEEMQGRSFREILEGKEVANWRNSMYYHYYEYPHGWHRVKKHEGVRSRQHKLIHFYDDIDTWELYDLEKDPGEMNNVYEDEAYAQIRKTLHEELKQLKKEYKATP